MHIDTVSSSRRRSSALMRGVALASLAIHAAVGCGGGVAGRGTCTTTRPICSMGPSDCCGDLGVDATCINGAWTCQVGWVQACSGYYNPLQGGCPTNAGTGGAAACTGTSPTCWEGPSECCGDVFENATCADGTWTCRQGYVRSCTAFYMASQGACWAGTGAGGVAGRGGAAGAGGMAGAGTDGAAGAGGSGAGGATSCTTAQAPAAPCQPGWYHDVGLVCSAGTNQCTQTGDGLCYRLCLADSGCPDPCFSKCVGVPSFNDSGGDGENYQVCRKP